MSDRPSARTLAGMTNALRAPGNAGARLYTELEGTLDLADDRDVIAGLKALRQTFRLPPAVRFAVIPLEADYRLVTASNRPKDRATELLLEELDATARARCGYVENDPDVAACLVCLLEPGHDGDHGTEDWWEARTRGELERDAAAGRIAERWAGATA